MTHTKGPWKFEITDEGDMFVRIPNGHDVFLGDMEGTCQACFANGRLIAAAPELLEALEALFENFATVHRYWGDSDNSNQADAAMDAARLAIAKAKGEA